MVAVQDKNNSVVYGRMFAGKIPASWQRIRMQRILKRRLRVIKSSISKSRVRLLFCHAHKMGKLCVLVSVRSRTKSHPRCEIDLNYFMVQVEAGSIKTIGAYT